MRIFLTVSNYDQYKCDKIKTEASLLNRFHRTRGNIPTTMNIDDGKVSYYTM
jgi:hypothetical protein